MHEKPPASQPARVGHTSEAHWGSAVWPPALADLVGSLLAEQHAAVVRMGATTMQWILARRHPASRAGWVFGLAFGAVHAVYAVMNNLNDLDAAGGRLLNNGLLASLVVLFGLAGWWGARGTGRVSTGGRASLLTWLVSSAIG